MKKTFSFNSYVKKEKYFYAISQLQKCEFHFYQNTREARSRSYAHLQEQKIKRDRAPTHSIS